MKCQTLFSGKNKKNIINLPSTENAHRVVKVNKPGTGVHFATQNVETVEFFTFCVIAMHAAVSARKRKNL